MNRRFHDNFKSMNILALLFWFGVFVGSLGLVEHYSQWHLPFSEGWQWLGYLAWLPAIIVSMISSFSGYKLARSISTSPITVIEFIPPLWLGALVMCAFILTWEHPIWQWFALPVTQALLTTALGFSTEAISGVLSTISRKGEE